MCNRYRTDKANAALFEAFQDWHEREQFDEHGRNTPTPFEMFPNTPGRVFTAADGVLRISEPLWGMPTPPQYLKTKTGKPMAYDPGVTNIRNTSSPHWRRWTGVDKRCLVPFTSFCENAPGTHEPTWFAFADGRPLAFFAGVRDDLTRQIKAKDPEPTTGEFFAFLTTDPNKEVKPIHPKAMPVILTEPDELGAWLTAPWEIAKELQRPLPDGSLTIVHRGKGAPEGHGGGAEEAGA